MPKTSALCICCILDGSGMWFAFVCSGKSITSSASANAGSCVVISPFSFITILPPSKIDGKETSYHIYALRLKDATEQQRDEIIDEIAGHGVAVNVHFIPMPMLTFFKNLGYNIEDYPQSYKNFSNEISLPIYPQLTEEEVDYVLSTLISAYEKVVLKR